MLCQDLVRLDNSSVPAMLQQPTNGYGLCEVRKNTSKSGAEKLTGKQACLRIWDLHSDLSSVDGILFQNPSENDPDGHAGHGRRWASSGTGCGISDLDAPGTKTRPGSGSPSATPASESQPGSIVARLEPHLTTERFNQHLQKEVRSGEARNHSWAPSETAAVLEQTGENPR
jgi:hypothetical protein